MIGKLHVNTSLKSVTSVIALTVFFPNPVAAQETTRYFLKMPYQASAGVDLQFSHEISKHQSVNRNHFKVSYDDRGRIISAYFRLGESLRNSNHASNRQFHGAGLKIQYEGNREVRSYYGQDGNQTSILGEVWQKVYLLDPQTGKRTRQRNEDREGNLVDSSRGFATQNFTHFEDNSLIEERFNTKGEPVWVRSDWDIYKARFAYKMSGELSSMTEVGGANRKAIYTFDARGAHASTSWFDNLTGEAIIGPQGVFRLFRRNSPEGYFTGFDFVDLKGEPAAYKGNVYYIRKFEHDRFGNTIHMRTYGKDGEPALESAGYHHVAYSYDKTGLMRIEGQLYGLSDEPIEGNRGFSRVEYHFDTQGTQTGRTYYNLKGEVVEPSSSVTS